MRTHLPTLTLQSLLPIDLAALTTPAWLYVTHMHVCMQVHVVPFVSNHTKQLFAGWNTASRAKPIFSSF